MDKTLFTPTPAEIWAVLSPINVNEHTKEKNGLTFLSWTWAWATMQQYFPQIQVSWRDTIFYQDCDVITGYRPVVKERGTTAMVHCDLHIDDCTQYSWLPVMDPKMNSMLNPGSRDISDSMMRCMVKGFAFFGLGHYIYAGEDLPTEQETIEDKLILELRRTVKSLWDKGYEFDDGTQVEIKEVIAGRVASEITNLQERLKTNAQSTLVGVGGEG